MHNTQASRSQLFKDEFLRGHGCKTKAPLPETYRQQNHPGHEHKRIEQLRELYNYDSSYSLLAGGDGFTQVFERPSRAHTRDIPDKRAELQKQPIKNDSQDNMYTEPNDNSSRSGGSIATAIEQSKRGKELLGKTRSKANLLHTLDQGIKGVEDKKYCSNKPSAGVGRRLSKETFNYGSEHLNANVPSSAAVINEKVIHPLITKFRLLYLQNIKEEVSIMEDLEKLPHKLNEVCRSLENE